MNRVIVSLIACLCSLNLSSGQTIEVCNSCDTSSIVEAIKIAKDFDTILVKKGTFRT